STICTQRSRGILIRSIDRQLHHESRTRWNIRFPPEAASMFLNDLLAKMQTKPHPARLGSLGLVHAICYIPSYSRTIVFNLHNDSVATCGYAYDHTPARVQPL